MRRFIVAFVVLTACVAAGAPLIGTAQDAGLGAARVSHVGVVVPDLDAALKEYVRVMGFAMPKDVITYPSPMPAGGKTAFKLAQLRMPNFHIEVIQPIDKVGP